MEQKMKFIAIGLMVILAISLFINLSLQTAKKNLEMEREQLKSENNSLSKKIEEIIQDNNTLRNSINALNSDMSRMTQEKDELLKQKDQAQKEFGLLMQERDLLMDKLKSRPTVDVIKETQPETQDAYWAGVLKTKADLALQAEELRSELKTFKINNEQIGRDLDNLKREKQELEKQVSYHQKMVDNVTAELVIERNSTNQQREALKSIKNENVILRRQVTSLSSRKADLEKRVLELQDKKTELEKQFNQMASVLENKLTGISQLQEQLGSVGSGTKKEAGPIQKTQVADKAVELPAIVVRPQQEIKATQGSLAKIVSINKENNFVVIDRGENAGLKLGDRFKAYRNNKEIATLEVIQARAAIAACDIKSESAPLRVGDIVK
ncbi:MAG: hypothetical protein A2166_06840 [Omnitrophica WOR_2 bacterium RBG_13_41_10]|nr:MAG: hypothetical protein A2166_06840 [Omnitrophica WOR_2 bacterium RBG_13_41_10]